MSHVLPHGEHGIGIELKREAGWPVLGMSAGFRPPTAPNLGFWGAQTAAPRRSRARVRAPTSGKPVAKHRALELLPIIRLERCNRPPSHGPAATADDSDAESSADSAWALCGCIPGFAGCRGTRAAGHASAQHTSSGRSAMFKFLLVVVAGTMADASQDCHAPTSPAVLERLSIVLLANASCSAESRLLPGDRTEGGPAEAFAAPAASVSGDAVRGDFSGCRPAADKARSRPGASSTAGTALATALCHVALTAVFWGMLLPLGPGEKKRRSCLWQCLEPVLLKASIRDFWADFRPWCCHAACVNGHASHACRFRRLGTTARGQLTLEQRNACPEWAASATCTFTMAPFSRGPF